MNHPTRVFLVALLLLALHVPALALDSPFSFTDAATGGKVVGTINGRMILKKRSLAVAWGLIQGKGVNQTTGAESTSTTVITESDFDLIPRI